MIPTKKLRELAAKDATPDWYGFSRFVDSVVTPTDAEFIAACSPSTALGLLEQMEAKEQECERLTFAVNANLAAWREAHRQAEQLAAVTAARDDLADIAESLRGAVERVDAWDEVENPAMNHKSRITELRKAGGL